MPMWNPWRGCHRYSEGCKFCYIHKGDARRGVDTSIIERSEKFNAPIAKKKNGEYRMAPGGLVYVCFSPDFLIENADPWRDECWRIMRERQDLSFLFLTKRILRFENCLPPDWGCGYENVIVGCTIENQRTADERLPVFDALPIRHKNIICQPLIDPIDLEAHLGGVELVVVGGESDKNARPLNFDWVMDIRAQCMRQNVSFEFRQCGTNFIKDGKLYRIGTPLLCAQARKADINFSAGAK